MNDKTWLIIYMIIGWATSIVAEIQCQSWKRKHGEAITAWIIESNNKDKQIYKLQEELENLKAKPVKHGKWEETHISLCKWIPEDEKEEGHSFYMAELKCSCCKRYNAVTFALTLNKPDFCQLCGARMDGDKNVRT